MLSDTKAVTSLTESFVQKLATMQALVLIFFVFIGSSLQVPARETVVSRSVYHPDGSITGVGNRSFVSMLIFNANFEPDWLPFVSKPSNIAFVVVSQ